MHNHHQQQVVVTETTTVHVRGASLSVHHEPARQAAYAAGLTRVQVTTDLKFQSSSVAVWVFGWCIPPIWLAAYCMLCRNPQTCCARCFNTLSALQVTMLMLGAVGAGIYFLYVLVAGCEGSIWYNDLCYDGEFCRATTDSCVPCPQQCAALQSQADQEVCAVWC